MPIRQTINSILPRQLQRALWRILAGVGFSRYGNRSATQAFSEIYETGAWGKSEDPSERFFSGSGSHDNAIVSAYVRAIEEFLSTFEAKPNVVDLGCGDFYVGSKIRNLCGNYIACDVVAELIDFNRQRFDGLDVDFRVLDITGDSLPDGDIAFVRQVLQHLSNDQIASALTKIARRYKYLILTEHLPDSIDFEHNLDKPTGPDIRINVGSGVVLTSEPFNLRPKSDRKMCQVSDRVGIIVTTAYELGD
jgi:hypothetical protein